MADRQFLLRSVVQSLSRWFTTDQVTHNYTLSVLSKQFLPTNPPLDVRFSLNFGKVEMIKNIFTAPANLTDRILLLAMIAHMLQLLCSL